MWFSHCLVLQEIIICSHELHIFSLIIHDCILTTEEKTPMVKTLLKNRVKELYKGVIKKETNLDKLFKVDIVSKAKPDY